MRTYRLMLTPDHGVEVTPVWLAKLRAGDLSPVYRIASMLAAGVLILAAIFFPLLTRWSNTEFGFATYLIILITFLIACLLTSVILVGSRRLVDPPLFMPALIFVFLVLAGLLFAPANARNTFGADTAKYLGGLWVMLLLGLYYMIPVFINSGLRLRWAKTALMCGLIVAVLMQVANATMLSNLFPLVVLSVPVLGVFAIETRRSAMSLVAGIIALIALVWSLRLAVGPEMFMAVFVAGFVTLLSWLAVNNWQFKFDLRSLRSDLRLVLQRRYGIRTFSKENLFVLLVVGTVVWLIITLGWMVATRYDVGNLFRNTLQSYIDAANSFTDIKTLIIGGGVNNSMRVSNVIASVIRYQGVVGLFAYIIVGISGFYLALQNLSMELNSRRSLWSLPLIMIVFAVPVYGLLANPGMALMVLWWAAVGILAAKQLWDTQAVIVYATRRHLQIRNWKLDRVLPFLQGIAIIAVFAFWFYLLGIVAGMASQGLI